MHKRRLGLLRVAYSIVLVEYRKPRQPGYIQCLVSRETTLRLSHAAIGVSVTRIVGRIGIVPVALR